MGKIKQILENDDGWSDWQHSDIEVVHKITCCDCGLTHNMEYDVLFVTEDQEGEDELKEVLNKIEPDLVVKWRAGRNNRSTGQIRRYQNGKI
jgi:hypothetical protein